MQSIMCHLKCHSFGITIITLFLGYGQEKVVQGIRQNCLCIIFLSTMKPVCKKSQILVERKTGRELLAELDQLCAPFLCSSVRSDTSHLWKSNREPWGQNAWKKGGLCLVSLNNADKALGLQPAAPTGVWRLCLQ